MFAQGRKTLSSSGLVPQVAGRTENQGPPARTHVPIVREGPCFGSLFPSSETRSVWSKLKSEYSLDELPLDPAVATILLEWKCLCRETSGNWVFPSPRTNSPYDSSSLRKKMLVPAAQRAKIQGTIGWHSLRHSYRAWLDETGAPLGVQQKLMRHANISTTMNVYGGAFMDAKRRANTSVVQRILSPKQS